MVKARQTILEHSFMVGYLPRTTVKLAWQHNILFDTCWTKKFPLAESRVRLVMHTMSVSCASRKISVSCHLVSYNPTESTEPSHSFISHSTGNHVTSKVAARSNPRATFENCSSTFAQLGRLQLWLLENSPRRQRLVVIFTLYSPPHCVMYVGIDLYTEHALGH